MKEKKSGKLKSRKWWIAVAVAAYFALMAIREQGIDNTAATVVCAACAAVVTICYLVIEGRIDSDKIIEGDTEENNE